MDEYEERLELAKSMIKSPLNTYHYRDKHGNKKKLVQ